MLFSKRSIAILFKTPVVPAVSTQPAAVELTTITSSRPRAASRTYATAPVSARPAMKSRMSSTNAMRFAPSSIGFAQQQQQQQQQSAGSIGAGIDDVAKTDAAFNSETNPHKAAKQVEQESGKSMQKSPANEDYSRPTNPPADTSKSEADKNGGFEKNQ
ncbi:hypothetical protein QFC20_006184 [Naganishia adeliensis]|uniref:Uncharacterized protein n=1 Tax=Naganishia adeliensis TaxID=92952 RepID=A0ACC2VEE4_9TREE|nr:hypothetical protein QFC20_006184 [Naganishia adeliensis]